MRVITDHRRLPRPVLLALAAVGWAALLYLAWVVGRDSWDRTSFSFGALSGAIPELDPFNERYRTHPVLTLFHTLPGVLFAILGPLQFVGPLRRRFPRIHRVSGRVFVVIGITSGIAAFVMTFRFPFWGMPLNMAISATFAAFMVFAFVNAVRHARARRFKVHREWMIRGFTAGMSVAFFRVMLNDVLPRAGMDNFDLRWNTVTVISFPLMLGVAEAWIRATRSPVRVSAASEATTASSA